MLTVMVSLGWKDRRRDEGSRDAVLPGERLCQGECTAQRARRTAIAMEAVVMAVVGSGDEESEGLPRVVEGALRNNS